MSTSAPLNLGPSAGKRAACDRCRGQKLRCIRDDQNSNSPQATCIRCFKAGATCSYDTGKRVGRSTACKSSAPQERRGNGHRISKVSGIASRSNGNPSGQSGYLDSKAGTWQDQHGSGNPSGGPEEYTADQESERETEDTTPTYAQSPSSLHDSSNVLSEIDLDYSATSTSSTATLAWSDEIMTPFSYQDAEEASGFEPFGSKYGWAFHNNRAQPMDIQIPNSNGEQHIDMGVRPYGIPAQYCPKDTLVAGLPDEAMDVELLTTSAHATSFDPTNAVNARSCRDRDGHRESAQFPQSSRMNVPASSSLLNDFAETEAEIKLDKESLSMDEMQHQLMQELSKLAMDLYAQLATSDPENHQPTSGGTVTAFQDHFIGSVLRSSDTFLTLLSSFSTPVTRSSSSSSLHSASSASHRTTFYDFSDSGTSTSSLASEFNDEGMNETVQPSYSKRPAGNSDELEPPTPIDMATVLQLLTCYIRIVHLHSIMHARMLDYMSAFLQHNTQHVELIPPVFPNMQVGGVSLNRFGTFQIKLLMQISVHVLGEIESALGLPMEFRVGKSKGEKMGVLGESVSGEFVKCLMNERSWRGKKLESVKEQLRSLRSVLKRAIAF